MTEEKFRLKVSYFNKEEIAREKASRATVDKWWGHWHFDRERLCLIWGAEPYAYKIDLEECTSSAEVLDWIIQLQHKSWIHKTDLADLVQAFDDLFYLQANFCSWGKECNPNPVEILQEQGWID